MSDTSATTATLLLSCPDQPGIVAAVSQFVADHGGNIVHAEQHTDREEGIFFQRVEFEVDGFGLEREGIRAAFDPILERFAMSASIRFSDQVQRVAVLVSKQGHCLLDLLGRWHMNELPGHLALVASNHPDHCDVTNSFGVDFHHLPVTPDTKQQQEADLLALLADEGIDLVVMARYMQILSPAVVAAHPMRIINIHHSFLPAFPGGRPYHQAHERGVKIVGVTAHYATADLDEGPIIEQDVVRVSHRDGVTDLVRKGRDLEMVVLARAVRAHLEHRILVYGNKTVVFG
ncbi:MAG: formyltetrahydrofolate deformylase [Acidimicrobiales bacterium]|nr:formyltetrahydrofolate deformylase [Acidimicrobiales bacterium]